MQLINLLQVALLVASQISAIPISGSEALTPNAANELVKRAAPAPVSCGPADNQRAWPLQSVQDAFNALVANDLLSNSKKPSAGRNSFPHRYGGINGTPSDATVVTALNAIPECRLGQVNMTYSEFPITDPVFTGGDPGSAGLDRVVAITTNTTIKPRPFTYCLAMTHRGVAPGQFTPCTNA